MPRKNSEAKKAYNREYMKSRGLNGLWWKKRKELENENPELREERLAEYRAKYHGDAKERIAYGRRYRLARKFKLTEEEYGELLKAQQGVCAICNSPPPENRRLAVDHDHDTDRVRGLLCNQCNLGIGNLKDSAFLVQRAGQYLIRAL